MNKFRLNLIKAFSVLFAVCIGFAITSMPAKAEDANFSISKCVSLRNPESDERVGIRFESTVNDTWLKGKSVKQFGTLIYPTANESKFNEETPFETLIGEGYLDAQNIVHNDNAGSLTDTTTFNASLLFDAASVRGAIKDAEGDYENNDLVKSVLKNLCNKDFSARSYAILSDDSVVYTNAHSDSMYKAAARTYALGGENETLALNYFDDVNSSSVTANIYGNDLALTTDTATTFSSDAIVILNDKVLTKQDDYNVENGTIVLTYSAVQALALESTNHAFYIIENKGNTVYNENNETEWLFDDVLTVVNAELLPIKGIEVSEKEGAGYTPTQNASEYLEFNYVYDNGTDDGLVSTESYSLNEDNITSVTVNGNKVTITVTVTVYNVEYTNTCEINVDNSGMSVTEFLTAQEGNDVTLKGIVVGFATNIDQNEVILTDGTNFISVVGLGGGDVVNGSYYLNGIDIGDEISILAKPQTSKVGANNGKVYAEYAGGSDTAVSVISTGNKITLPAVSEKDKIITSTSALETFLKGANQYKLVKFNAEMNFVMDENYELYNFWLYDDTDATSLEGIKVNRLIPTFSGVSTQMNAGQTFSKLMINGNASSLDYTNPHNAFKAVTALYLGGNETHAQFVILSADSVGDATAYVDDTATKLNAPTKLKYSLAEIKDGFIPDLAGCTIDYVYTNRSGVTVEVTEDMLRNVPNITEIGDYTIYIEGEGRNIKGEVWTSSFEIAVKELAIKSVKVDADSMPKYNHRNTLSDVSFEGVPATITYEDGSTTTLILSDGMIKTAPTEWALDTELTYTLTYSESEFEFDLSITFVNEALSISNFWSKYEAGEIVLNDVIDVMGVVINPALAYADAGADFILKDTTTNDVLPLLYTEQYDTGLNKVDGFNEDADVGEVIIVEIIVRKTTSTNVGNYGKVWGNATSKAAFDASVINVTNYVDANEDFDLASAPIISTQDELISFIGTRKTQIVKLEGVRFAYKSTSYYALFFDESFDEEADAKYTSTPKFLITLYLASTKMYVPTSTLNTYLTKDLTSAAKYDAPAILSEGSYMYAMFIGGDKSYLKFAILDDSWVGTTAQA